MGVIYSIRCRKCGNAFNRKYGVGYNGQGSLYCDRCGKAHVVDFSCGWGWEPSCECGGTFDADAMGCCPQCGSLLSKEDIDKDKPAVQWE